jgi:hypothetical protein
MDLTNGLEGHFINTRSRITPENAFEALKILDYEEL